MRPDCAPMKLVFGLLAVIVVAALNTGADAAEADRTLDATAGSAFTGHFTPRYTLLYGLIDTSLFNFPAMAAGAAEPGGVTFRFDTFGAGSLRSDPAMPGLGTPWFAMPGRGEPDLGAERGRGVAGSVLLQADPIGYVTFAGAASAGEGLESGAIFPDGVGGYDSGTFTGSLDAPSSVVLSLAGGNLPLIEGFTYRLTGMQRESADRPSLDETAYALAGEYSFTLGNMAVAPSIEFVHLDSLALEDGDSQDFLTKSLTMMWRNWNLSVSHTDRTTFAQDVPTNEGYVVSLEAGYGFGSGLSVDAGWRALEEDGVFEEDFGVRFTYDIDF